MDYKSNFKEDLVKGVTGEYDMAVYLKDKNFETIHFNTDAKWDLKSISPNTGMMTFFEVKTDFFCKDKETDTGNIAVEIRYKGRPSGISSSESDVLMYYFPYFNKDNVWMIKINKLKEFIKNNIKDLRVVKGGDDNQSEIVLIPREKFRERFHVDTFIPEAHPEKY